MRGAERKLMGVSPVIQGELGFSGGLLLVCLVLAVLFFVFPVFGSSGVGGVSGLCVGDSDVGGFGVVGSGVGVSDVGDFDVNVLYAVPMAHEILRKRRWPKPVKASMSKTQDKHNTLAVALAVVATPETALSIAGYCQNSNRVLFNLSNMRITPAELAGMLQSSGAGDCTQMSREAGAAFKTREGFQKDCLDYKQNQTLKLS